MAELEIRDFARDEWTTLITSLAGLSLMQCWEFGAAKAATGPWRAERGVITQAGDVLGAFQALIRPLPMLGGGLAWINRGPLWKVPVADDLARYAEALAALRRHYAERGRMYLRIAPPVMGRELGAEGFRPAGTPGWGSAVLDLEKPDDVLRAGLAQKWRNSLNQAERSAIEMETGTDDPLFARFLALHADFMDDKGFRSTVTADLLSALRRELPTGQGIPVLLATQDGVTLGWVLLARHGGTAEYLAGGTTEPGRRLNAGQLLLWRAVLAMKEAGAERFDLGGMDPDLTPPGIYRFKRGLGGTPYRLAPELEALGGGPLGRAVRWRVRRARAGQ